MDKTVPAGAALLLDFIGNIEAPGGYGVIFANRQDRLDKPLTSMTLDEVLAGQATWSRWKKPASSAAGRYQFMRATLTGLKKELGLRGTQKLDADLQDRLGFHLLKRRGYDEFVAGEIGIPEFGKRLAQEWASLPVLAATQGGSRKVKRGQSYYAGDGLNKSLTRPEDVEALLERALLASRQRPVAPPAEPTPPKPPVREQEIADQIADELVADVTPAAERSLANGVNWGRVIGAIGLVAAAGWTVFNLLT